jgi:glycerol-3-phosphate dehydrogenase (NAD(P)+)
MSKVAVLGAGAWGLTIADLLAGKGHEVQVWLHEADRIEELRTNRTFGTPPELRVNSKVEFFPSIQDVCRNSEFIICAVASFAIRPVCKQLKSSIGALGDRIFVNVSKGIENSTLCLPQQIFQQEICGADTAKYAVLTGPSLAGEVCRRIPTVVTASSSIEAVAIQVQELFMNPDFRVYTNCDCRGAELGGALKNVMAVAAGICDGLGFGANTKSALITRGLAELARAGAALGARPETLYGLAGLGDLVTTCMSPLSRNRSFGELVGQGVPATEALQRIGATIEGYHTARAAHELGKRPGIEMPISFAVYEVLYENRGIRETIDGLLTRDPKPEAV